MVERFKNMRIFGGHFQHEKFLILAAASRWTLAVRAGPRGRQHRHRPPPPGRSAHHRRRPGGQGPPGQCSADLGPGLLCRKVARLGGCLAGWEGRLLWTPSGGGSGVGNSFKVHSSSGARGAGGPKNGHLQGCSPGLAQAQTQNHPEVAPIPEIISRNVLRPASQSVRRSCFQHFAYFQHSTGAPSCAGAGQVPPPAQRLAPLHGCHPAQQSAVRGAGLCTGAGRHPQDRVRQAWHVRGQPPCANKLPPLNELAPCSWIATA